MWLLWKEARQKRRVNATAEIAVAEALNVESPARVWKARTAKWRRGVLSVARIAFGLLVAFTALNLAEWARQNAVITTGQSDALVYPIGLVALHIVKPGLFSTLLVGLRRGWRQLYGFFHWSGPGFYLFGLLAFYGAVFLMMGYVGLAAFEKAKWLTEDQHASRIAWMEALRPIFLGCVAAATVYRLPALKGVADWPVWTMKQGAWIALNLFVMGIVIGGYEQFFLDSPPSLESLPTIMGSSVMLCFVMGIIAANQAYFGEEVAWFDNGSSGPSGSSGGFVVPAPPRPNLLT